MADEEAEQALLAAAVVSDLLGVLGQNLVDEAKRTVWPRIREAVEDLCAGMSGPLLEQLAAIEDGLREKPLYRRGKNGK